MRKDCEEMKNDGFQDKLLRRVKKATLSQQMPLEDYVVCLILLEQAQDSLEDIMKATGDAQVESRLKDTQDAELTLREKFCALCGEYKKFKEAEKFSDIRDGIMEYTDGNKEQMEYYLQIFSDPAASLECSAKEPQSDSFDYEMVLD